MNYIRTKRQANVMLSQYWHTAGYIAWRRYKSECDKRPKLVNTCTRTGGGIRWQHDNVHSAVHTGERAEAGRGSEILINKWIVCIWKFSVCVIWIVGCLSGQFGHKIWTKCLNVWILVFLVTLSRWTCIWDLMWNYDRIDLCVSCRFKCILLRESFDDSRQMNIALQIDNHLDWLFQFFEIIYCFTVKVEARLVDDVKILRYTCSSWFIVTRDSTKLMTISSKNVE